MHRPIRAGLDQTSQLRLLVRGQAGRVALRPGVLQPIRTVCVEAVNPLAQRLAIRAASVRLIPSRTAASDSKRRLWLACLVAAASRRSSSAEKAVRTLMADGMARVLPAPWNQLSLQHGSPVSQKRLPLV